MQFSKTPVPSMLQQTAGDAHFRTLELELDWQLDWQFDDRLKLGL